ncbi:cation efflux family-domain-containing protein [Geopyxis carbonaria]|nr:cation efflux family-domain-containing protein [Geopyxis carbonaria]
MSTQPIPIPPGSPNVLPPTPTTGLGIEGLPGAVSPALSDPDAALLSPLTSPTSIPASPPKSEPTASSSPSLNVAAARRPSSHNPSPFNFQPMVAAKSPVTPKQNQRRGHKYKHSSVSHQIFLEPPVRAPLTLPASLPIPTWKELYKSISPNQRTRLLWCLCHFGVAGFTLYSAQVSLALTALSHLIVFDALGASLCVAVDVLSNFEVWKRSSIRHPFGLERAEVLAGFAMSVFLLFMGFDIISHTTEHLVEGLYEDSHGHAGAHVHEEHLARVSAGSVDLAALAALLSTTISAMLLKNHARIGKAMQFAALSSLPSILSNPSHLLTILCSTVLLLIPLLSLPVSAWLDRTLALTMALAMITLGVRLVKVLGSMLLMSYGGTGVPRLVDEIASDPAVREVQEARFWQAHHGLCIATVKLVVADGGESAERSMREKITRLVRDRLGGVYGGGKGGAKWEVSVAITTI